MSPVIDGLASSEARGEPDPGVVRNYRARLLAQGYSPGLTCVCIRTILHLIALLSANQAGIETLDNWRAPSLRKDNFRGVHDELLAKLADP